VGTTGAGILGNDWDRMSCSQRSPKLAGHRRSRKEQRDRSPAFCGLANQRIDRRHEQPVISKRSQGGSADRVPTIPRDAISRPGRQTRKCHERGDHYQDDRAKEQDGHDR